jgi:hypothetical protein
MELHLIYTYETRRAWNTGGNKLLQFVEEQRYVRCVAKYRVF